MTPDTLFWIASLTKSMTSTLVMMLVDEGKLALDSPVEQYLTEFRGQTIAGWFGGSAKPRQSASVADLMRHLSGIPQALPTGGRPFDRMTLAEKSRLCGTVRLASQPGEKACYANANYEALGRLIEVVSDASYEDLLRERLLEPLGMRDTTFRPNAAQLERLALPYAATGDPEALERRPFVLVSEPFDDPRRTPAPSFGLFSTASDCLRFAGLHVRRGEAAGRRLFSEESAELLLRRFEAPIGAESQGLAWGLAEGAAFMTGTMGAWMTLHLRRQAASVILSASADFWQEPQAICKAFVRSVTDELRERTREDRRQSSLRRQAARSRRRRYSDAIGEQAG